MKTNHHTLTHGSCLALVASLFWLIPTAPAATVFINATANIFGAGHATPPEPAGGGAGTLPSAFALPSSSGRVLTFSNVTGIVHYNPGVSNDPDGNGAESGLFIASYGGISGITNKHVYGYLVGVFLNDAEPVDPAPPGLDFTDGSGFGRSFTTLAPLLQQTFFIGDGLTGTNAGAVQQFLVPNGATRFFLGFADAAAPGGEAGFYADNSGGFDVTFRVSTPCPIATIQVGDVDICWSSQTNKLYQVQYRSDLTTNMWVNFAAPVSGTGSNLCVTDSVRGQPRKFYRVECLSD